LHAHFEGWIFFSLNVAMLFALGGHNHIYQRWAPQDAHGNAVADGVVPFTVGTGARSLYPFGFGPMPENLEVTQNKSFGVLKLTLHKDSLRL